MTGKRKKAIKEKKRIKTNPKKEYRSRRTFAFEKQRTFLYKPAMDKIKPETEKAVKPWGQDRDVWCFLGLPFDAVTMEEVCAFVEEAIKNKTTSTLSASNINWLVLARKDPVFREHVACSNLNVMDGTHLFWGAKFLGLPFPERIAGPTLIEQLMKKTTGRKKEVYFCGGSGSTAERACRCLRDSGSSLTGVGFSNPGFGHIDDQCAETLVAEVNKLAPDILVLAVGAQKSMAWIERDKQKLRVGVVSHLGAVINLVAGNIKRAPIWFQTTGLEWAWRIFQEPKLWKRYFFDGLILAKIIATKLVPLKGVIFYNHSSENEKRPPAITLVEDESGATLRVQGVCNRYGRKEIREAFLRAARLAKAVKVDMEGVTYIESSFLGNLFFLWRELRERNQKLVITKANKLIRRIFFLHMVDGFFKVER